MDAAERLLVGDVIHKDEAHGAPVVGSRDGPVPLLPRCVLKDIYRIFMFFNVFLIIVLNCPSFISLWFKINPVL